MRTSALVLFTVLALTAFCEEAETETAAPEEATVPTDVIELKVDTFRKHLEANPVTLVEFYASWCGHCKALAPIYEKVATALKAKNIPVARIDPTVEEGIGEEEKIEGFPTIRLYVHGEPIPFEGERDVDSILSFVETAQKPAFVTLTTAEEVAAFREENEFTLMCYPGDIEVDGLEAQDVFTNAASSLRFRTQIKFALIKDPAFIGGNKEDGPTFVLFRKDIPDKKFTFLLNDAEDETPIQPRFESFCLKHGLPLADTITGANVRSYISTGLPFIWFVVEDEEDIAKYPFVAEVAKEYVGKLLMLFLIKKDYPGQVDALNTKNIPGVVATDRLRHPMNPETPVNAETFKTFVSDYVAGKIPIELKSEPIPTPEEYAKMTVKKVVSKSWYDVINDTTKDVLVKYYATWCGHCKALAPTYEKLAELLTSDPEVAKTLVIAEYNMPENEVDHNIGVQSFPTIILYPAAEKLHPVTYDGDRTLGSFIEFIQKYASNKFTLSAEAQKELDTYLEEQKKREEETQKELDEPHDEGEPLTDEQVQEIMKKIQAARESGQDFGEEEPEEKEEL